MTTRARGTRFQLAGKVEATDGTAPSGNWAVLPCYSFELDGQAPLKDDEIISMGLGRDPYDQYADTLSIKGAVKVPLEAGNLNFWMSMIGGAPASNTVSMVTTDSWALATPVPSFSFEKALLDLGLYFVYSGCKLDSLALDFGVSGAADMTLSLIGRTMAKSTSTSAGTPTTAALARILKKQGIVTIDGSQPGDLTAASFTVSNNLEEIRTIRTDTSVGSAVALDEALIKADGKLTLRMDGSALYDDVISGGVHSLVFSYVIDSTHSISFTFPRVSFDRPSFPIKGPAGVEQSLNFSASHDPTAGAVFVVSHVYPAS